MAMEVAMAALQLRLGSCLSPSGGSEGMLVRTGMVAERVSSVSTRRNVLTLKGVLWQAGPVRPLELVVQGSLQKRVVDSLPSEAYAASVSAIRRLVAPVVIGAPLLGNRVCSSLQEAPPVVQQSAAAVGLIVFALWCLAPPVRFVWGLSAKKDSLWEKSQTRTLVTSYIRPLVLWTGIITMCRAFDSVELELEASLAVKQRIVNFVRSLATVLIQQVQKHLMKRSSFKDSRNVSLPFIGNAVSTSVWIAAVCLFLEHLGFSTHKWLAAGGYGTVILTLAGREIFTNFLSSVMIQVTKPFVESEWIQTKIEGQEVSGTVEHVGWWSPTVIRGDEREAVLIPNHKFSVSVVRNLTQKTHWRIKTYIGINHHDVKKINRIVADMRKVLANHPGIEQKRLHRRVFFDHISSKNLALMIMVSCFVKTSRFEEYLRVKEGILLDLLKVVAHHRARLATPVRSVQRLIDESESRTVSHNGSQARPFLLNGGSTLSTEVDQNTTSSNSILNQKSSLKKKTLKESSDSVDTVTDSLATDTKQQTDPLSKWKALKNLASGQVSVSVSYSPKSREESVETTVSCSNDGVPASSAVKISPMNAPDDMKESDIRSQLYNL